MSWLEDLSTAWKKEYADLDTTVLAPMTRLARLSVLIDTFQQVIVAPFGVSTGEYAVLAALRRAGSPYQLSPSKLYSGLQRSSGGMTKSLKKLQRRGLVERMKDPHDGRGSLVSLTSAGLDVQDQIFKSYLVATQELFRPLSPETLAEADTALTHLLEAFEIGATQ
jgi:DNA-binding MarR family transcriptional regulator